MKPLAAALALAALFAPSAAAMDAQACVTALTGIWHAKANKMTSYLLEDGAYVFKPDEQDWVYAGAWGADAGASEKVCQLVLLSNRVPMMQEVTFTDADHFTLGGNTYQRLKEALPPPPQKKPG